MRNASFLLLLLLPHFSICQLFINEAMSSNKTVITDEENQFDDWIEIYNAGVSAVDLQSYYLSDNPANPLKWEIDESVIVPAGGFVIFWADEDQSQGPTHTNFKLSVAGESVYLANPSGTVLDQMDLPEMQDDFSFGRLSDGGNSLTNFSTSSPGNSNSSGVSRVSDVLFSIPGGVYSNSVTVTLSTITNGATIRYTVNGSEPTNSSSVYSGAISITNVNTIRAKAFRSGWESSETTSESYLVGVNHTLPIVTVNTHPDNLWDDEIGIHVAGTNGITGNCSNEPKNWNQAWERPANIQFYDESGSLGFNIDAGLSIAGACSRRNAQKSLNIETKSDYPSENIPYQIFPTRDQHEFRRFKLRAGGNDWDRSALRDASAQRFVENEVDIDLQSARTVIVYLNDEYWGVMNMRDVHSQHSINYKHPKVKKDSLNIFKAGLYDPVNIWDFNIKQGQADDFLDLYNYIKNNNLANNSHYEYVSSKIDINEFINYQIVQTFIANTDWPSNNLDIWHEQSGKARWLLYDTDFGLGRQWTGSNPRTANPPSFDAIVAATSQSYTGWPNDKAATLILNKLLTNTAFKNEFVQRYATQLNILFNTARTTGIVNDLRNTMAPEMQGQLSKFNLNSGNINNWHNQVDDVVDWLTQRPPFVYTNIRNYFGIGGTYLLTLNVTSSSNGRVLLNENEYLAPLNYTGKYFDGVPVILTAVADPGYRFSHWQETGNTDARISPNYTTNTSLTPVFVSATDLVINEIHYNPLGSSENAEFIELYNPDTNPRNLSGMSFTDGLCFSFPSNTILNGGDYLIIAHDASVYQGNGYQVFEWEDSKLDNNGELLSLSNGAGKVIDSLSYNDGGAWISTADNGFYSLALIHQSLDNNMASAWDVQSQYITPGAANQFLPYDTFHGPSSLVINEIHYNPFDSISPSGDTIKGKNYEFIELKNLTSSAINLTGYALSRGATYQFPAGSSIPANGFIVLAEDSLQFIDRYGFTPFGKYSGKLSDDGELIWFSNTIGQLVDAVRYDDASPWESAADGGLVDYSLGLVDPTKKNDIYINWRIQCGSLSSPGQENDFSCFNGLSYNGLLINEIHYDPAAGNNYEFIELVNNSSVLLNLREVSLAGGITFTFDTDLIVPGRFAQPANYVVLAKDSSTFHNLYGFAAQGEYSGSLSNTGETVRVEDFFDVVIDQVSYSDSNPWPVLAGLGQYSAALISPSLDNSLGQNWCAQDVNITPKNINTFGDSDGDNVIDCLDICPNFDDQLIGSACDDNDPCTTGETYNSNCQCSGGVFQDTDNDDVCDANDQCQGIDDAIIGQSCEDGDACTSGETFSSSCQCTGGVFQDSDNDGVCDANDQCQGIDDAIIGQTCEDGDVCTSGETFNSSCQCTGGVFQDADNDGVCNAEDQCPGFDDTLIGQSCDDGDICTIGELYQSDCSCAGGVFEDSDSDGICDANDICPNFDDNLIGQACNDGDDCTNGETYQSDCSCSGGQIQDANNNGVCDLNESGCDILYADNFESNLGIWQIGGGDAARIMHANSPQGDYSLRIRDNSGVSSSVYSTTMNLSAVEKLRVGFNFRAIDMEPNESFKLELSTNGGASFTTQQTWIADIDFVNNAIYYEQINIPASMLSSTVVLRFQCEGSINSDEVFLDNIILESCIECADFVSDLSFADILDHSSANIAIESNGTVKSSNNIQFNAGNIIELMEGFTVELGAVFHAYIAPCN